jgi:hypothetical protein
MSYATVLVAALAVLAWRGRRGHQFRIAPLTADDFTTYFDRDASFRLQVQVTFPHSPPYVFQSLLDERFMSWTPFTSGVKYRDGEFRGLGTRRMLCNTFFTLSERIVLYEVDQRLGATVEGVSVPWVLCSAGTLYEVGPDGGGGSRLTWRIGGKPKWLGRLPLRVVSLLMRPAARSQIKKLQTLVPPR